MGGGLCTTAHPKSTVVDFFEGNPVAIQTSRKILICNYMSLHRKWTCSSWFVPHSSTVGRNQRLDNLQTGGALECK